MRTWVIIQKFGNIKTHKQNFAKKDVDSPTYTFCSILKMQRPSKPFSSISSLENVCSVLGCEPIIYDMPEVIEQFTFPACESF